MIIEFRVENHRSIRSEQSLTFLASGKISPNDPRLRIAEGLSEKILPVIVIYGGNASGKSNVLSAIAYMREAVLSSNRFWTPEEGVPRDPFAWGAGPTEDSMFELTFLTSDTKFCYGFVLSSNSVQEEWLHAWPVSTNRMQKWFERDGQSIKFGEHLDGPNEAVRDLTRSNALFLSTATQFGHASLATVFREFTNILPIGKLARTPYMQSAYWDALFPTLDSSFPFPFEENSIDHVRKLLLKADLGVVDVRREEFERTMPNGKSAKSSRIKLKHRETDDDSWLNLDDESEGTKTLFRMAPHVIRVLQKGGVLIVDELEASLHPLIALELLRLFHSPTSNWNNGQLLFTTHDTNLLGTTLGEPPLRRDQVWFTEKNRDGESSLYPLTNFKPRNVENLERGYLQGRYGAIPFLGDFTRIGGDEDE